MRITRLSIQNFRGIKQAGILLPESGVLVGDNNTGKSTVLEAIDLVLGPERLNWHSPIDEHDFYAGEYIGEPAENFQIKIEVVVTDLSIDQQTHFGSHLEFWDKVQNCLLDSPPPEMADNEHVIHALRVGFIGVYDPDDDCFTGKTVFLSSDNGEGDFDLFKTRDKRFCGFLFLRTLRTGSRALSLERGSLLDIILRLEDKNLDMWEDVLDELRDMPVAENEELGITQILETVQDSIRNYVSSEWSISPHIRVSDLTRETLRKTLTMFIGTGATDSQGNEYSAPFNHQGTGTVNTLVLALLSVIADLKQNVIFAMEEPEIAIPPHAQRRVVDGIKEKSAQSLFTSHSPYVLDEFPVEQIVLLNREDGQLTSQLATLPPGMRSKRYKSELRTRFCECLLARRVLIVEGRTEYDAIPVAARRLAALAPETFKPLESLGLAVIDAETETQIAPLAEYFSSQGKEVYVFCDQQTPEAMARINRLADLAFESPEKGFEQLTIIQTEQTALWNYALRVVQEGRWPQDMESERPYSEQDWPSFFKTLGKLWKRKKGEGEIARVFEELSVDQFPAYLKDALIEIQKFIQGENESELGETAE